MLLTFPMPSEPVMDMFRGSPSLHQMLTPVVGDVAMVWRKARPKERPGYAPADPKKKIAEVVPPVCYALEVDVEPSAEREAQIRAAVAAWQPGATLR